MPQSRARRGWRRSWDRRRRRMALGEWCSMAEGEGERGKMSAGGEGEVVCVARRWAFKTRAVSGARLSLPPPTQPTLPDLTCLPRVRYSCCLACFGSSARWPVHGLKSVWAEAEPIFESWRKERAWACSSSPARLLRGAGICTCICMEGHKNGTSVCIFTPFKGR